MKKILVRKIFQYDPTLGGKYSRYDGYKLITLKKASPGINKALKNKIKAKINTPIYCSSLLRAVETATLIKKDLNINKIRILSILDEITFDLEKLVTKDQFDKEGSNLVRQRFIEAFTNDQLLESREKLKKRITKLINTLEKLPPGMYLLISHSFFMKILQIYLKHPDLFENPKLLKQEFNPNIRTFEFGKGFDFTL